MAVLLLFCADHRKTRHNSGYRNRGFGDHTLKVLDILYVQTMEHRVCIYTKQGELVERSRFRDLVQILNDIDGVQPHRSYWVPTHAILHLEGDADRLNIVLTSGEKIAVARTRRSEIEEWAKEKTC